MGKKPGPNPGIKLTEAHRDKIRNSKILQVLIDHAEGKQEMSATRVQAATALLDRILPKLQATELTGKDGGAIQLEEVKSGADAFTRQISGLIAGGTADGAVSGPH